mmetsp:Transcript_40184/g.90103  ORF Transcript_40184/g.90103 Transcript_40184/m.90103 type:complete len:240 (+) Transcript_40184:21-740(+)
MSWQRVRLLRLACLCLAGLHQAVNGMHHILEHSRVPLNQILHVRNGLMQLRLLLLNLVLPYLISVEAAVKRVLQVMRELCDHLVYPGLGRLILRGVLLAEVEVIRGIPGGLQALEVVKLLGHRFHISAEVQDTLLHLLQVLLQVPSDFLLSEMTYLHSLLTLQGMCQRAQGLLRGDLWYGVHQGVRCDERPVHHHGLHVIVELLQKCVPDLLQVHSLPSSTLLPPANDLRHLLQEGLQL